MTKVVTEILIFVTLFCQHIIEKIFFLSIKLSNKIAILLKSRVANVGVHERYKGAGGGHIEQIR